LRGIRAAGMVALACVALRVVWLLVAFLYGFGGVRHHHLESGALILAALLLAAAIVGARRRSVPPLERDTRTSVWTAVLIPILGAALYYQAVHVGLLSDDFVLLGWASALDFVPRTWGFVRPVPLVVWAAISHVVSQNFVSHALHALNLGLHCLNAVLVVKLAARLGIDPYGAVASGLFFVAFPLQVETVVWASAIFDVALVTICLLTVLSILSFEPRPASAACVLLLTILALLTKETGVALPVVAGLAVFAAGADASRYRLVAISSVVVVVYVVARFAVADSVHVPLPPSSGYAVKELLSRPFAALVVPAHESVVAQQTFLALVPAILLPPMFTLAAMTWWHEPMVARRVLACVGWVLACVAPLLTMMYVAPDLQGSRYLYLPSVAWSILLADLLPRRGVRRPIAVGLTALMLMAFCIATRAHIEHWVRAGQIRDRVLEELDVRLPSCGNGVLSVPSAHNGAYIFRNGLSEALQMRGVHATSVGSSAQVDDCIIAPSQSLSR
jgi:hypothetical protein